MKKKRLSIYVTMLGLAMATAPVFTSCEDMLEEKPYDFISPDDVPDSDDGADMWTTGVYETLHSSMFRYGNMPRPFDYDCDNVSGATWQFDQFGNGNFQGSNNHCDVVWTGMYSVINRANEAIEQINEMKNLTARHRDNVLGECYFLKAWAYFMLVRAYGDIPVYSVSVNQSQQYTNSPRIPIKDVYTQTIIPLLDDAKDMLYKNTDTNFQAGRVCAASAAGLLAKVYATIASAAMPEGEIVTVKTGPQFVMQNINGTNTKVYTEPVPMDFAKDQVAGYESFNSQEYYQLAYDVAKDVKGGVYGTHNLESYDLIWSPSGKTCSEHLFSQQSKSGDELYGTLFTYHYCGMTNEKGHIENSLTVGNSKHWYLLFEENDYRVDKGVLHCWIREGSDTSWGGGSYFPNFGKWQEMVMNREAPFDNSEVTAGWRCDEGGSEQFFAFTTKYSQQVTDQTLQRTDANYPFLRYADVILIMAEASNELKGPNDEAIGLLNDVRKRSNATPRELENYSTKSALRSAILEERSMEFAMEGDRRWDLIRWGIYLQAMNALGGTDVCGNVKSRSEKHLLFPIPTLEVLTNQAISSNNPGWS